MALIDMSMELQGSVPGLDLGFAATLVKEAWTDVRNKSGLWSFQLAQGGFASTAMISGGTVTLTFGSATVTGDATAAALWAAGAVYGSLITQRQFRRTGGTIYNIIAYDGNATLTLDRPYTDPLPSMTGANASLTYMVYQPYYATPVKNFRRYLAVLDCTNVAWLGTRGERKKLDISDPQRQIFSNPLMLYPYGQDTRSNSSTSGWMLYELYPQPIQTYAYQTWYEWQGPDLVNLSDTLPFPITEELVKAKARVRAYEWAEANKDPANPRGAGADFRFLMGAAETQYKAELKKVRLLDRDRMDLFCTTMNRLGVPGPVPFYNNQSSSLTVSNLV